MNLGVVEQIAKAVLYEGYMLYPYRPSSVKNQQRWNFGVLCPQSYSVAQKGSEAWTMQTECLVEGSAMTGLEVRVRFLQLVARTIGELTMPVNELLPGEVPEFRLVERLAVDGRVYQPWQEAVEREVILPVYNVEALAYRLVPDAFSFPRRKAIRISARRPRVRSVGVIIRERKQLCGALEIMSERVEGGVFKISVRVCNTTPFEVTKDSTRDDALLSSLASTHTVLGVQDGRFVSLIAPPEALSEAGRAVQECRNLSRAGRRRGAMRHAALLAHHPLRLSPDRSRKRGRLVRWHRD